MNKCAKPPGDFMKNTKPEWNLKEARKDAYESRSRVPIKKLEKTRNENIDTSTIHSEIQKNTKPDWNVARLDAYESRARFPG